MAESTVLVIDDDPSLRRVMEFTLEEAGYRVLAASTGEQGLELFRSDSPDLVITDIQMPGISGYEVLSGIKETRPETLVLVITAFGSVDKAVKAMRLGAFDYLTKPFGREELALAVEKALKYRGLERENEQLREQLQERGATSAMIGVSEPMKEIFEIVEKVAATEASVLISGESGTGKELIARALHQGSDRRGGPFVPVNCAAIPENLLESELFGHARGSFTGALKDRKGKFEQADGGTLFLDEVGELPLELQSKLLRALQERVIEPVGGTPRKVDVRLVAATNRDLEHELGQGGFREDLYYRLAVIPVHLPPLRQRSEDVLALINCFLHRFSPGTRVAVAADAMERLRSYSWPGNVRELQNAIERMLILKRGENIELSDLPPKIRAEQAASSGVLNLPPEGYPLEQIEKEAICEALARNGGNQTKAAAFLSIPRHTLIYRLEKYGIGRDSGSGG